MIRSNQDLYQIVRNLIETLKASDENKYAKKLEDALSISNVPSEILMLLRFELLLLLRDRHTVDRLGIEKEANDAVDYLNSILGV